MLLREVTVGRVGVGVAVVGPVNTILFCQLKWLSCLILALILLHPELSSSIIDIYQCNMYLSVATAAPLEEVMLTGILCESSGLA